MRTHPSMKTMFTGLCLVASVALTAWFAGCAAEVGDISRVQPDAYRKSIFDGEWYSRPTIIRTQFHQGQAFEGLEGALEKVRWEVQEQHLIAYRSYENIPNTEPNPGSHSPIAIFAITSHFDIQREYNPANGAETNVLVENTTDRPWWERTWFRVDWSANLVNDFDLTGFVKDTSISGVSINQTQDPYEPMRPRISEDYVDVVTRTWLRPDYDSAWDWSLVEVNEVDIRWSFRKVKDQGRYEPLLYPDYLPVKVRYRYAAQDEDGKWLPCTPSPTNYKCRLYSGAPSSGDPGSCPSARETETPGWLGSRICHPDTTPEQDCFCHTEKVDLFVTSGGSICDNRITSDVNPEDCSQITYPVFERFGFFRTLRMPFDWEREYAFNSRIYLANRWNIWKQVKDQDGQPLPYAAREPKPIVYYTNPEFPSELLEVAQSVAAQWNKPFRDTVALTKGIAVDAVPDMFVLRRNTCNKDTVKQFASDHDLEEVLDKAIGGVDRLAQGNLTRACTALEVATADWDEQDRFEWQRMGDLRFSFMHWVHTPQQAGPLGYGPSAADPETGEIISATANIYGAAVDTYANFCADMVQLLNGEVPLDQFADGDNVIAEITAGRVHINEGLSKRTTRQLMQRVADVEAHYGEDALTQLPSRNELNRADPRSALALADQNSRLGVMAEFAMQNLVTEDMLKAFAGPQLYQAGQMASPEALDKASPTSWGRYPDMAARMGPLDQKTGAEQQALGALDREAKRERFFAEKTIEFGHMLVEPAIYGLALSLKGKSRDEVVRYARREVLRGTLAHEVGHTIGLRHNFSGSADALNYHKRFWLEDDPDTNPASRKWDYAYSSIMDYHQRFNSDWAGIGPYDEAAIRFGYGQLVDTFDSSEGNDFYPEENFDFAFSMLDYKDIPRILGGNGAQTDKLIDDAYHQAVTGQTDMMSLPATAPYNVENLYKRKAVPFTDVFNDYLDVIYGTFDAEGSYVAEPVRQHHMVPYQFCSDLYAWGGNLTCNRYDMGANIEEVVRNSKQMYEGYYLFNNFRRDRYQFLGGPGMFGVGGYLNRLYSRTFQPMLNAFRYFYYYRRSSYMMYPLVADWATGAFNGLNFFASVLQQPEPGRYCLQPGNVYVPVREALGQCDSPVEIPLGDGRYFTTRWTDEYYYKADRVGSYWDKWLATVALTDSQFFLLRNYSSLFDRGAFSITYYRVFEQEMGQLFRAIMEGNLAAFSAGVRLNPATGQHEVVPRPLVPSVVDDNLPSIKPAMTWSLQKQAAFYAVVGFTSTVDRRLDFARRARITYQGSGEDPLYEGFAPDQIITFTDPTTHLTYRAAPVGTHAGQVDKDAPGYAMVLAARTFHEGSWEPARQALTVAQAELAAAIQGGNAEEIAAKQRVVDAAADAFNAADRKLRERVDLLEYVRILGHYMHLYID